MTIRTGGRNDLPACIAILETTRAKYQEYEPRFWKRAPNAAKMSEVFLAHLTAQEKALFLVSEADNKITGFLIATPIAVPPVYDAGPAATIDDFCVADDWLTTGAALLREARAQLKARGFEQLIVVTAYRDDGKMAMLKQENLSLASAWWVGRP